MKQCGRGSDLSRRSNTITPCGMPLAYPFDCHPQQDTEVLIMKTNTTMLTALLALLLATPCLAADTSTPAGGGSPAAGGKGPGSGHDYRRNVGGPGRNAGDNVQAQDQTAPPAAPPMPAPPTVAPGLGYPYPAWQPQFGGPYPAPYGYMTPWHRQGYGYPGYRGRGGSGYPGHRQYGNPPGYPPNPAGDQ